MRDRANSGLPLRAAKLFAVAFGLVIVLALFSNVTNPRQMDFMSFWAAGKLTLAGDPLAAFDVEQHRKV